MNEPEIIKEDVLQVAKSLHMSPTEEQIKYVIDGFDGEADRDPSGNWELWIESLLYEQGDVEQNTPPKKVKHFLYDITTGEVQLDLGEITELEAEKYEDGSLRAITEKQLMVEQALIQIKKDIDGGDLTAIEGLLQVIPFNILKDFLPEL
jgi:hypothetical protein